MWILCSVLPLYSLQKETDRDWPLCFSSEKEKERWSQWFVLISFRNDPVSSVFVHVMCISWLVLVAMGNTEKVVAGQGWAQWGCRAEINCDCDSGNERLKQQVVLHCCDLTLFSSLPTGNSSGETFSLSNYIVNVKLMCDLSPDCLCSFDITRQRRAGCEFYTVGPSHCAFVWNQTCVSRTEGIIVWGSVLTDAWLMTSAPPWTVFLLFCCRNGITTVPVWEWDH